MCKIKKITISPGKDITSILRNQNNMQCYGLWTIFSDRVKCMEVVKDEVIEILTQDPIAFDLLIGLVRVTSNSHDSYNIIEFKEGHSRDSFIAALSHSKQMVATAGSNYLVVFNPQPAKKKIHVIFWDLRKFTVF